MKIVSFIFTMVLALSWSFVGMAVETGEGAPAMVGSEGHACCGFPVPSANSAKGAYKVVSSEKLRGMLDGGMHGLVVIDARTPEEYRKAHIKGATSIPLEQLEKDAALLDAPKDAKLVFYCNGVKCGKSKKAAIIAIEHGYKNVFVYVDGIPVWKDKGYPLNVGAE